MKEHIKKMGKKKLMIICAVTVAVIALAIAAVVLLTGRNTPKSIENKVDKSIQQVINQENIQIADLDKALAEFDKSENGAETIYKKGSETVKVKVGKSGNITYFSYNNELSDNVQIKLKGFNESMIKIGDSEEAVLQLLEKYDYIYQLKTQNDKGKALHIYYYGWTSKEAVLELVFTDGKLSYYTINSDELAVESDAPDIPL